MTTFVEIAIKRWNENYNFDNSAYAEFGVKMALGGLSRSPGRGCDSRRSTATASSRSFTHRQMIAVQASVAVVVAVLFE